MDECRCEAPNCAQPGTICPICEQCFCWQHLQSSSCEACHKFVAQHSFEHRVHRLAGIGLCVLLCGFLFLLLPRDGDGIIIQLAILLLVSGFLLLWLGMLARV